jgi:hypothetical protein
MKLEKITGDWYVADAEAGTRQAVSQPAIRYHRVRSLSAE